MKTSKTIRSILSGFVLLAASSLAFAAPNASILISGSVPAILEISVTAAPAASSLPLTTTVSNLPIATVVERSNKKAGYTVELSSANATASGAAIATLNSSESPDVLPYILRYAGNAVVFQGGKAVVSDVSAKTNAAGTSRDVTISFDGASYFLDESTYSDTLTFTVIAK